MTSHETVLQSSYATYVHPVTGERDLVTEHPFGEDRGFPLHQSIAQIHDSN